MITRLLVTALAALLFTAQAEAQRQRSEALEIARATQLRGALRDVPREDLEEALRGSPDMSINYALDAVGVATGVFGQATSLSRLGEAGVFAALAFFAPTRGPESRLALFGWMPREDAASPKDANVVFQGLLLDAYSAALPEYHLTTTEYSSDFPYYVRIDGPGCEPCGLWSELWRGHRNPGRVRAPDLLGRYPAYRWGGSGADGLIWGYPMVEWLTVEERLLFFPDVERPPPLLGLHLPPAPRDAAGLPADVQRG